MFRLINSKTREEVRVGATVKTFRGETGKLTGLRPPHKISSSGHVSVKLKGSKWDSEFYPSVIDAEYVWEE